MAATVRHAMAAGVALGAAALLAGCGAAGQRTPALGSFPLPPGSQIVAQQRTCDPGGHAYCHLELVVVDPLYGSAGGFVDGQAQWLAAHGWTAVKPDTGQERAAVSPRNRVRATFATAYGDLQGIDLGWIQRSRPIALALSKALFARESAMSVLLEVGTG